MKYQIAPIGLANDFEKDKVFRTPARKPLASGVVESFNVAGLTRFFIHPFPGACSVALRPRLPIHLCEQAHTRGKPEARNCTIDGLPLRPLPQYKHRQFHSLSTSSAKGTHCLWRLYSTNDHNSSH